MSDSATNRSISKEEVVPSHRLREQMKVFAQGTVSRKLLDSIPALLLILNRQRQIVYANQALCDLIGERQEDLHQGLRPGDALDCVYAKGASGGCSTADACRNCGAAMAIFASLNGHEEVRECNICREVDGRIESFDLKVCASPWEHAGDQFTLFTILDISHEKRRRALEHVFFHDVLNIAGSVKGYAELLRDYDLNDRREVAERLYDAMQQVVDEIEAQRLLVAAETGEIEVAREPMNSRLFLEHMLRSYRGHEVAGQCCLCLAAEAETLNFISDPRLLGRVLGNLIKNALEASRDGDRVTLDCRSRGDMVEFRVHNPAYIPYDEQIQIFRRSFSTKGRDRGLGTYSIRLLSECLEGEVSFTSCEEQGTTFIASYPVTFC